MLIIKAMLCWITLYSETSFLCLILDVFHSIASIRMMLFTHPNMLQCIASDRVCLWLVCGAFIAALLSTARRRLTCHCTALSASRCIKA